MTSLLSNHDGSTLRTSARRGQPRRTSKLQREIIAFYSRQPDGYLCCGWRSLARRRDDEFLQHLDCIGTYLHLSAYYRSRQNLIDKGYLEPCERLPHGRYGDVERGHRLSDRAVVEFLGGDRTRQIPPWQAMTPWVAEWAVKLFGLDAEVAR